MTDRTMGASNRETVAVAEWETAAEPGRIGLDRAVTVTAPPIADGLPLIELSALDQQELALLATLGC